SAVEIFTCSAVADQELCWTRNRRRAEERFVVPLPEIGCERAQHFFDRESRGQTRSKLERIQKTMGDHPTYLEVFLRTQNFILRGDGPLPADYRHYIAIIAAARHQCSYLVEIQKEEFLEQGGDPGWLRGLQFVPQKLHELNEINKILAHRPWLLNKCHIERLTRGSNWSLAEVVHAIVLLTHFHALASFVFGCGINDHDDPDAPAEIKDLVEPEVGVDILMERMKSLSEREEEFSIEEQTKRFLHVECDKAIEIANTPVQSQPTDLSQFVEDPDFLYQDFQRRGEMAELPTFRVQDYSWEDHGYSLVNRLYNDVGNLLDEKFKTAYNLTYYTMGGRTDVDTSRFRRAIWNYIHCMFGIRHDDYDYGEVNQLLERWLKAYIKSTCCFPERITTRDYISVLREFEHSEKIHVNLMVLEARLQAELLYALRVVMKYMT
ncbi:sestrin-3, partial [Neocloeon triangulifer]|uniref:sestrin-3 n=1 Tax=Neocloeon triangulifer TaxID=2078957 RepID=UPI00286F7535